MTTFRATLQELLTSKKALAVITAILVYVAGHFGFDLDPAALDRVFGAILVYVVAQGAADIGKGAAQVAAKTTPHPAELLQSVLAALQAHSTSPPASSPATTAAAGSAVNPTA